MFHLTFSTSIVQTPKHQMKGLTWTNVSLSRPEDFNQSLGLNYKICLHTANDCSFRMTQQRTSTGDRHLTHKGDTTNLQVLWTKPDPWLLPLQVSLKEWFQDEQGQHNITKKFTDESVMVGKQRRDWQCRDRPARGREWSQQAERRGILLSIRMDTSCKAALSPLPPPATCAEAGTQSGSSTR